MQQETGVIYRIYTIKCKCGIQYSEISSTKGIFRGNMRKNGWVKLDGDHWNCPDCVISWRLKKARNKNGS